MEIGKWKSKQAFLFADDMASVAGKSIAILENDGKQHKERNDIASKGGKLFNAFKRSIMGINEVPKNINALIFMNIFENRIF